MRILVADDSDILRRRLIQMIEEVGTAESLHEAENYAKTMQQLSKYQPDVLVLDIRMPGGSGMDVLRALESDERPPMIIVFTNYSYPQYFDECRRLGADYCFDKSADIDNLVDVIRACSFTARCAGVSENKNR